MFEKLLHPEWLDIDRLLLLKVPVSILEATIKHLIHHGLRQLLSGGQQDPPEEMTFRELAFVDAVRVKEPHESLVICKLLEQELDCELGVGGCLELRDAIFQHDIFVPDKNFLQKLHPATCH